MGWDGMGRLGLWSLEDSGSPLAIHRTAPHRTAVVVSPLNTPIVRCCWRLLRMLGGHVACRRPILYKAHHLDVYVTRSNKKQRIGSTINSFSFMGEVCALPIQLPNHA
ncbi:hypothetical protein AMTR_s00004p00161850 [Amborella trichopoda]|uniref:Uncharacterized protein n=1 Tax=Amborella trichopoda TaxID=13333 RepID=W1NE77_AMBTC|nr:hypothetical protein AMTR_s00004p00161850 [Amborella trichopoda]